MKERISKSLAKAVKNMGRRAAARDANTGCYFLLYQPKLPEEIKKFKFKEEDDMQNSKLKKILGAFVVSACLMATAAPVLAQTVDFDITVPGDILSKRAVKKDWEQRFYVTGTSFSLQGTLRCTSINRSNGNIKSRPAYISPDSRSSRESYISNAPSGQYYYMTTSSNINGIRVLGRYTP